MKNTLGTHCALAVQNQIAYNKNSTFILCGKKITIAYDVFSSKRIVANRSPTLPLISPAGVTYATTLSVSKE
jgi:hypothetical protein